ncbi:DEKNAAC104159 [Brettanomyces naardenensis]|uniref:DEKNAAC104159 n=1 Tax=Brettanomyces naardenensis TaxID=13370 RepID=A0A448YQA8_BRENA|nr:DEKNAAC104159 [Brettanomyces naardenensis]
MSSLNDSDSLTSVTSSALAEEEDLPQLPVISHLSHPSVDQFSPEEHSTGKPLLRRSSTAISIIEKVTTIKFDDSKIVPKNERRGLFHQLTVLPEYVNPRELPGKLRHFFVFIIAFVAMVGPMGTSILFPATDNAVADLHTTVSIFNVAVGVYLITLGVIPMWWSNFSERHGRRSIYIISFTLNVCFTIGCALSKDVNDLIAFRVLSGGCAASVQAVGAGTISDLYPVTERGTAMGIFYLGPLAGPLLAPIIGGAITSNKSFGWRGTQWFLVILSFCGLLLITFFLPETLRRQDNKEAIRKLLRERRKTGKKDIETGSSNDTSETNEKVPPSGTTPTGITSSPNESLSDDVDEEEVNRLDRIVSRLSMQPSIIEEEDEEETPIDLISPLNRVRTNSSYTPKKSKEQRLAEQVTRAEEVEKQTQRSSWQRFKLYFKIYGWGPLKSFVFLRYPPITLAIAYSAPCFAALYVVNMSLTYCYSRPPYNFGPLLVGLVYIPNSVAYFIASVWGGKFTDYLLKKKIEKYGVVAPEARFGINVFASAAVIPASLLITGWCLDKKEQWVTPLIGTALFGFAQMIVIGVTITYLADCLPGRGATGVALNNFIRQLMAAGVSFATAPLINAIGAGPLFSICAGITAVLSVLLLVIVKRGDYWRETYDLERLYDIVDD